MISNTYNKIKQNINIETTFLLILFGFVVLSTAGHTIIWGVIPLLYIYKKSALFEKTTKKDFLSYLLIFSIIFILNFLVLYSFKTGQLNSIFSDYNYYAKIASVFNSTGAENFYTSKNTLFPELNISNISTQYRFFDIWIIALLFKILPFNDLTILQIVYMPLIYSFVSYAVFKNINFKNYSIKIIVSILFLFLFGDAFFTKILRSNSDYTSWFCFISWPKLALFFIIFLYFFKAQFNKEKQHISIIYLSFLPILIQVSFPIYIFIYIYILYNYKYFIKNKIIVAGLLISTLYYLLFYIYNIQISKTIFDLKQFETVHSVSQYLKRILSITYHFITKKLIVFGFIVCFLLLLSNKSLIKTYFRTTIIATQILFSGVLVYAFFPSTTNSTQFLTNFLCPVLISLVFIFWNAFVNAKEHRFIKLNLIVYIGLTFLGISYQYENNVFFGSQDELKDDFIKNTKIMLTHIKNPIGLTYWNENFEGNNTFQNSEVFNQYGTDFLIRIGANYDVVCLSAINQKIKNNDKTSYINKYYAAINLYKRNNKLQDNINLQENFYNKYKFEFLITNYNKNDLPYFLKNNIVAYTYNKNLNVYCYKLK